MVKTVFCTQCGKEIPEEAKFCLSCGAPQEIPSKSEHPPEPERSQLTPPPPPPSFSITSPPPVQSTKKHVPWGMIGAVVVVILVAAGIYFILTESPTNIPLPGASPTATPTTETPLSLEPGPTQTVPPGTEVQVQVNKNNSNGAITFLFSGGPGQKVVRSVDVKVIRGDGTVLSGTLKPVSLYEVVLQGTRGGTDRVEVSVTYLSGNVYTIIDRQIGIRD